MSEFVRKRGHMARSQEKAQEQKEQEEKEQQEQGQSASKDQEPLNKNSQNNSQNKNNKSNKNNKKTGSSFERQRPTATEKTYNEKEPEERKPYKKLDRAPGAPDFR